MSEEAKEQSIWVLTITRYTDDYKPRAGNWSSHDDPLLFHSEREANRYLRRFLMEWCFKEIDQVLWDSPDNERYQEYKKEYNRIYDSKKYDDIKALAEKLTPGEYIVAQISWDISEVEFQDPGDFPGFGRLENKGRDEGAQSRAQGKRRRRDQDLVYQLFAHRRSARGRR